MDISTPPGAPQQESQTPELRGRCGICQLSRASNLGKARLSQFCNFLSKLLPLFQSDFFFSRRWLPYDATQSWKPNRTPVKVKWSDSNCNRTIWRVGALPSPQCGNKEREGGGEQSGHICMHTCADTHGDISVCINSWGPATQAKQFSDSFPLQNRAVPQLYVLLCFLSCEAVCHPIVMLDSKYEWWFFLVQPFRMMIVV